MKDIEEALKRIDEITTSANVGAFPAGFVKIDRSKKKKDDEDDKEYVGDLDEMTMSGGDTGPAETQLGFRQEATPSADPIKLGIKKVNKEDVGAICPYCHKVIAPGDTHRHGDSELKG